MVRKLLEQSVKGISYENEDIVGVYKNYVWVMDGATDLFDTPTKYGFSVSQVMQALNKDLPKHCKDCKGLKDILYSAISEVNKTYLNSDLEYNFSELPTFAFMFGRFLGDIFEYIYLGDCYLISYMQEVITDSSFAPFVQANRDEIKGLKEANVPNLGFEIKEVYRRTRHLANKPKGYKIGSLDPKCSYSSNQGSLIHKGKELSLMSDGFYNFYTKFGSVERTLAELHNLHLDGSIKLDDATVLVVKGE